jgi:hypothetical protein
VYGTPTVYTPARAPPAKPATPAQEGRRRSVQSNKTQQQHKFFKTNAAPFASTSHDAQQKAVHAVQDLPRGRRGRPVAADDRVAHAAVSVDVDVLDRRLEAHQGRTARERRRELDAHEVGCACTTVYSSSRARNINHVHSSQRGRCEFMRALSASDSERAREERRRECTTAPTNHPSIHSSHPSIHSSHPSIHSSHPTHPFIQATPPIHAFTHQSRECPRELR